ncbi:MAG: hypothetical protein VXW65_01960 [Pseudomonadota bacterium]|nr:hypothetical protein [Pseudomonadota bacterium]
MVEYIKFRRLDQHAVIKSDILSLANGLDLNVSAVQVKGWVYATLDDNQIFQEDAENLSHALNLIDVKKLYGCWVDHMNLADDFDVMIFDTDKKSIEDSQNLDLCLLDADHSYIFGDDNLKFLIIRPDRNRWPVPYTLIVAGSPSFVQAACADRGWIINDPNVNRSSR